MCVLKFQLFSLTSIPPDDQKIFGESNQFISTDSDLDAAAEKLRLVSINDDVKQEEEETVAAAAVAASSSNAATGHLKSDEELARMLQAEEEELFFQQFRANENQKAFEGKIRPYMKQVLQYEDPVRQEAALRTVPVDELEEKAMVSLAKEGNFRPSKQEEDHALLLQLLFWCNKCSTTTRFPRYNDPLKVLENLWRLDEDVVESGLIALHFIVGPLVMNLVCWGKKLNYVIGIAKDGVYDVTRRYTRKWHEVLSRRNITTEPIASAVLSDMRNECRKHLTSEEISKLEDCDRKEAEELERGAHSQDADLVRLPGRQSGAKEWRLGRGEMGANKTDSWSSSCPLRICVDDHVTEIYNALSHLLSQLISNDFSKATSLELLEMIKSILVDIQKLSFKVRKTSMSVDSGSLLLSMHKVMPSIDGLLAALSLKRESLTDGKVCVCLSGDPVKTSLALPVAVDAIENGIVNVRNTKNFGTESLSLPLLTFNRICSGSVIASGEELPFGIATSAFDGTLFSKWEEPNGAKG
ncbi:Peptide-N(4)-(N-acetyl-beta-glucosaminyl)asparagine amidase [Asimina triloba]